MITERSRALRIHGVLMAIGVLCNIAAFGLLWVDAARAPYVDKGFSYSADVVTADTDYDAQNGHFFDTTYSLANFHLGTSSNTKTLERSYGANDSQSAMSSRTINPVTGQYSDGRAVAVEYIFAPRNTSTKDQFYFEPLDGGSPVLVKYDGQEVIQGLTTYRFKSEQHEQVETGIQLEPNQMVESAATYEIWVEPTSGWLVKYKHTTANNVVSSSNRTTIIRPVSQSSSMLAPQSIDQHVAYAKSLRAKRLFIVQVGPSLFIALVILLLAAGAVARMRKAKTVPIAVGVAVVLTVSIAVLLGWLTGIIPLTTFLVSSAAMNPLTAVCFVLLVGAVFAEWRRRPRFMALFGGVAGLLAFTQLLASLGITNFRLDTILFSSVVEEVNQTTPSLMSPYVALALLVISSVFVARGIARRSSLGFLRFVVALTVMLGVLGVILNVAQVNSIVAIPFTRSLSLLESILLVALALTTLQVFYRRLHLPQDLRHSFMSLRWAAISSLPIVVIGIFAQTQQATVNHDLSVAFDRQVTSVNAALSSRFELYARALYGARGLLVASQEVTPDEWSGYNKAYRASDPLPGLDAVGYARIEDGKTTAQYVESALVAPNAEVLQNPTLQGVIRQAVKTGAVRLSSNVSNPASGEVEVYMIAPVYKKDSAISTVDERQRNIDGFVYGVLSPKEAVSSATEGLATNINFELYSGDEADEASLLYRRDERTVEAPRLTKQVSLFAGSQAWMVSYYAEPGFRLSAEQEYSASAILLVGSAAYCGFLATVYMIIDVNRRNYERTDKKASHR